MTELSQRLNTRHLIAIAAAGFMLTLPVLAFGLPFLSDDAGLHAAWYAHFSQQLWMGDLYPRWLMDMNGGLGSPVFFFYPPVPYFFTSLLRPFFANDATGLHQLGVAASVAMIASGLTAYFWLKNLADEQAALLAAILYMAMPYHLASDLYVRASFAEYWTFVWMPLILYFVQRTISGRRLAPLGVAVSYALLCMTHLPTTIIFSAVLFCYAFALAPKNRRLKTLSTSAASAILGVGLAAIYLLPAMTTQQFVFLSRMTTGYFSYQNWLFFAKLSLWKEDKIVMALLVADMFAIATCAFLIIRAGREIKHKKMRLFWYAVAIASVLMMTEVSKPVWLAIPVLQKIQFPWRFNTVLCLATTALLAIAISSVRRNNFSSLRLVGAVALLLIVFWIPPTVWRAWKAFPQTNPDQNAINDVTELLRQNRDAPEYRPRWNKSMADADWELSTDIDHWDQFMAEKTESVLKRADSSAERPSIPIIIEGTGRAEINARKPREIDLHVETSTGVVLIVPQFYYPYWTARADGANDLAVTPSQPDGLINLSVPAGNHEVRLRLGRGKPETVGQIISLVSLVIVFFAGFAPLREKYRTKHLPRTHKDAGFV